MLTCQCQHLAKDWGGGLAWIKYPKKDIVVTFSYSPLQY